jgi:hypothetical protein
MQVRYFRHGYGCAVELHTGKVDFDFGEKGEIDGFDLWRLSRLADGRLASFGFGSEKELERAFDEAVR